MRQLLTMSLAPRTIHSHDCAWSFTPLRATALYLDLVLDLEGKQVYPVVTLRAEGNTRHIMFQGGFKPERFFSAEARREFQRSAEVWFEEEEPGAGVLVIVIYKGTYLVQFVREDQMEAFLDMTAAHMPGHPAEESELDEEYQFFMARTAA